MFCSEVMRVSTGKRLRNRSAASVADEMEHLARQGVNICSFQDDSFSASRRFVQSLCEELIIRKSKMPWMARVRVDELSYELLDLMKKAGCVMLGLGVESGCERIIGVIKKQQGSKPWLELCRQAFGWTRALGIGTNAYYVLGNPTETREEIEQTIRLRWSSIPTASRSTSTPLSGVSRMGGVPGAIGRLRPGGHVSLCQAEFFPGSGFAGGTGDDSLAVLPSLPIPARVSL